MIYELVYTSVAQGLKPGTTGFCVVAMSREMHPLLVQHLERLSSYRHVNPPGSSNPVAKSFSRATFQGKSYLILSRISDAGLDYSGRSNHIAHHIAIESTSEPPAGPAYYLERDELFYNHWNGPPRYLPAREIPQSPNNPKPCIRWQNVTGDAGWATAPIEFGLKGKTCTLIVRQNVDSIALFAETIALLPVSTRWKSTFSTYYTKAVADAEFQWRMVQHDSPEAKTRETAVNAVIDLTTKLGPASGRFADDARFGRVLFETPAPATRKITGHEPTATSSAINFKEASLRPEYSDQNSGKPVQGNRVEPPAYPVSAPPVRWAHGKHQEKKSSSWAVVGILVAGIALGGIGTTVFLKPWNPMSPDRSLDFPDELPTTEQEPEPVIPDESTSKKIEATPPQPDNSIPNAEKDEVVPPDVASTVPSSSEADGLDNLWKAMAQIKLPENYDARNWGPGSEEPLWKLTGVSREALGELDVQCYSPLTKEYEFKCETYPNLEDPTYWEIKYRKKAESPVPQEYTSLGKILFHNPDNIQWAPVTTIKDSPPDRAFLYSLMKFSLPKETSKRTDYPDTSFIVRFKDPDQTSLVELLGQGFDWKPGIALSNELTERIRIGGEPKSITFALDLEEDKLPFSDPPVTAAEIEDARFERAKHELKQVIKRVFRKAIIQYEIETSFHNVESASGGQPPENGETESDGTGFVRIKLAPTLKVWFKTKRHENTPLNDNNPQPDIEIPMTYKTGIGANFDKELLITELNNLGVETSGYALNDRFPKKSTKGITRPIIVGLCNDFLDQVNRHYSSWEFDLIIENGDSAVPIIHVSPVPGSLNDTIESAGSFK